MNTLLLNGSPKGNAPNSASYLLARAFADGMAQPCEIRAMIKEERRELLELIAQFDHIIAFLPNYIHAIPGDALDIFYGFPPAVGNQSLGFIIQSGYPESSESELISRFFEQLAPRLGYGYLGTVIKGECAGLGIMPDMYQKLIKQFSSFGALYAQNGCFDQAFCQNFANPHTLSRLQVWTSNVMGPIGNHFGWNKMLKEHNAYDRRMNTPYLD